MPDIQFVLGEIGADSRITDVRWAAYLLATVFVESSHIVKVTRHREGAARLEAHGGRAVSALVLSLALVAGAARATPSPPAAIAGVWDVAHVRVDQQDAPHWNYRPDDPRLVGRKLVISAGGVELRAAKLACAPSSLRPRATTWGVLFARGFPRPEGGPRAPGPKPQDFLVDVPARGRVVAYSLCPSDPVNRGVRFPQDTWVAPRGPDELALHLDSQVLLLLRRRPAGATPAPTFACAEAGSPTEKAICADVDLAAWDRSVAQAFTEALARGRFEEKDLRAEQAAWLSERDGCGADAACIATAMHRRVNELALR